MTDRTHEPLMAVVFRLGVTGRKIVEILLDRKVRIVAAVDAFQLHGERIGAVLDPPTISHRTVLSGDLHCKLFQSMKSPG